MKLDLSLNNEMLYAGADIEEVAGKLNLKTPVTEAVNLVGRNVSLILNAHRMAHSKAYWEAFTTGQFETVKNTKEWQSEWDEITLTGPMAVWSYLVVFHCVVHRFSKVYYDDGRSGPVLIAAHG